MRAGCTKRSPWKRKSRAGVVRNAVVGARRQEIRNVALTGFISYPWEKEDPGGGGAQEVET